MKRAPLMLATLALMLGSVGQATAGLIGNGGFETPVAPGGGFLTLGAGDTSMNPWAITSNSVDVINNGYWAAYEGSQSLDLAGGAPGTIAQAFATTAGTTYTLTFAYANNADFGGPAFADVLVSGTGILLHTTITHSGSVRNSVAGMDYVLFSESFTADSSSATLQFADQTGGAQGIVLDAVDVNAAAPEPASMTMLGFGVAGLIGYGWRRRKQATA